MTASRILGCSLTLAGFLALAWLLGRRELQEFLAATVGFLLGLLVAMRYRLPMRGTQ